MVKKSQILYTVISTNLKREQVGDKCDSAFSMVHQCMKLISAENLSEQKKKEKLTASLQSFWRNRSKRIDGCKREQLQAIAELVFGINERCGYLRNEIRSYKFEELYLYYCYVERMAKGDAYIAECTGRLQKNLEDREKARKQKREMEKQKRQEEEENRIGEMSKEEKWQYEIHEKKKDMEFFRELDNKGSFDTEERREIARLLMEYWKKIGKWEGGKVSKKQAVKIDKVKAVLNGIT